ncbi:MAG: hypothetical protein ACE5DY_06640 [Mariprofundaceae bacterium]
MTDVAEAGTPAPAETNTWTDGLSEENKGLADVKQWGSMDAVFDSYRAAESHIGAPPEQLLRLPTDPESADWAGVYEKMGRPQEVGGYELEAGQNVNEQFFDGAKNAFFEAGLSQKQGQSIIDFYNGQVESQIKAQSEQAEMQSQAEITELKAKWGNGFDAMVEQGRRAGREFGVDEETMSSMEKSMGTKAFLELFANIGGKLGEDSHVNGEPAQGSTPDGAKEKINQLRMDTEFMKAYMTPGHPGHVDAVAKMQSLHNLAYV